MKKTPNQIILETLDRLNRSLDGDENAILAIPTVATHAPEAGYIALVSKLIDLRNI